MGDQRFDTAVQPRTCDPEWNEHATFLISAPLAGQTVVLSIYSKGKKGMPGGLGAQRDTFLGKVQWNLAELPLERTVPTSKWLKLQDKAGKEQLSYAVHRGELRAAVAFVDPPATIAPAAGSPRKRSLQSTKKGLRESMKKLADKTTSFRRSKSFSFGHNTDADSVTPIEPISSLRSEQESADSTTSSWFTRTRCQPASASSTPSDPSMDPPNPNRRHSVVMCAPANGQNKRGRRASASYEPASPGGGGREEEEDYGNDDDETDLVRHRVVQSKAWVEDMRPSANFGEVLEPPSRAGARVHTASNEEGLRNECDDLRRQLRDRDVQLKEVHKKIAEQDLQLRELKTFLETLTLRVRAGVFCMPRQKLKGGGVVCMTKVKECGTEDTCEVIPGVICLCFMLASIPQALALSCLYLILLALMGCLGTRS